MLEIENKYETGSNLALNVEAYLQIAKILM